MNGTDGIKIWGADALDHAGTGVSSAGDVNGDGFDDLMVGTNANTNGGNNGLGTAHIIYGGDFRIEADQIGNSAAQTMTGSASGDILIGGGGNDVISGGGGGDSLAGGSGNDELHVTDGGFLRVDGGGGIDSLHFDMGGSINFGDLDGNSATSGRGHVAAIEILDVANGQVNSLALRLSDVLDMDLTAANLGGNSGLDNALRIDGEGGDSLSLEIADGWTVMSGQPLAGYQGYQHLGVTVLVDQDITITVS